MNMQAIMAQAQRMQKDVMKKKDELDKKLFTGKSEWIEVVFNGAKEMVSLKITYDGVIESDDREVLEDMMKVAINDAFKQIDREAEKVMGPYGNALNGLF